MAEPTAPAPTEDPQAEKQSAHTKAFKAAQQEQAAADARSTAGPKSVAEVIHAIPKK